MSLKPYWISLPIHGHAEQGFMLAAEAQAQVPFPIARVNVTWAVPADKVRGNHANHQMEQMLVCLQGLVQVRLTSQAGEALDFTLEAGGPALYMPAPWWRELTFSPDALLLMLSSQPYDESFYWRDRESFFRKT